MTTPPPKRKKIPKKTKNQRTKKPPKKTPNKQTKQTNIQTKQDNPVSLIR